MATDTESFNRDLYDLLKVRGYDPLPLSSQNQRVGASQDADVIEFQFTKDGEEYGKVWITVDDAQNVIVYYDEEQQTSPSNATPGVDYDDSWTGLLKFIKNWAQRRQMSFELANKDRLGDDMRQREYYKMKEKLGESYHPMGKKASYNDAVPNVKIVLQHNRALEEGEQRYRNVARIYLENVDGERFLAPTNKPGVARVYARHIAEGGLPNDERWNHIKSVCEDYNKMAGFVRATRNGQFNESAGQLVEEGINHYNSLRENLHKLATHRGYQAYFESWTPTLMEGEGEDISEMFMSSTLDPRIESAMPILSRLHKPVTEMAEVDSLAEWADSIISEKLEIDEAWLDDKKKFSFTTSDKKSVDTEASSEQEARSELAAKLGIDPKALTLVQPASTKTASTKDASDEDDLAASAIDRAKKGADTRLKTGKVGGIVGTVGKLIGFNEEEISEMDKERGSRRGFDGPRGQDKTSKAVSVKDFAKSALKSLNRSMKGWEKGMHDVDTVKSATKSLSPDQKEKALAAKAGKGSPAELQQKLIKREKNKQLDELDPNTLQSYADKSFKAGARAGWAKNRADNPEDFKKASDAADKRAKGLGMATKKLISKMPKDEVDEATGYYSEKHPHHDKLVKNGYEHSIVDIQGDKLHRYIKPGVSLTDLYKYDDEQVDENSSDRSRNRKMKMATDYEERAKKTSSPIKKDHYRKMADEIRSSIVGDEEVKEDLGPEQKRVGQLGPTEKVKNNNIGKLVGASESKEMDPELARIIEMAKFKR